MYLHWACDAGNIKFRSGTHGPTEEPDKHRGRKRSAYCVMMSVRALVMFCESVESMLLKT